VDNPITRFRLFMESRGWWSKEEDDATKERLKQEVMTTFKRTEKLKRHELKQLFEDVYGGEEPWNIVSSLLRTCSSRADHALRPNSERSYLDSCVSMARTGSHGSKNWTSSGVREKNLLISSTGAITWSVEIITEPVSVQNIYPSVHTLYATPWYMTASVRTLNLIDQGVLSLNSSLLRAVAPRLECAAEHLTHLK